MKQIQILNKTLLKIILIEIQEVRVLFIENVIIKI